MIIVHPDHVVGLQQGLQPVGEHLVDAQIAGHVAAGELHQIEPIVEDRPQHAIGKAVVEFLEIAAGNIGRDVGDAGMLDPAHRLFALRHGLAAPAEPDAAVALEERAQHHLEAACPGAAIPIRNADAVRHHHYPRHDRSSLLRQRLTLARRGSSCADPAAGGIRALRVMATLLPFRPSSRASAERRPGVRSICRYQEAGVRPTWPGR
jgi:hypothetical protein